MKILAFLLSVFALTALEQLDAFVKNEAAKWGKAVKASGAKVD